MIPYETPPLVYIHLQVGFHRSEQHEDVWQLGVGVKEQFMGKNKYLDITREGKKEAKS